MTLAELERGQTAVIHKLSAAQELGARLQHLGLIPGLRASVLRRAPLGDPLQVEVEGTLLSIRRCDAQAIEVLSE